MSNKQMYLVASTNNTGSDCDTPLDITEGEWVALNDEERGQLIGEFMGDVVDIWVEARDQ